MVFVGLMFDVGVLTGVTRGLLLATDVMVFELGLVGVDVLAIVVLGLVTVGFRATVVLVFVSMVGISATLIGLVFEGLVVGFIACLVVLEVTGLTAGLVVLEVAGFVAATAWVGFLVLAGISGLLGLIVLFGGVTTGVLTFVGVLVMVLLAGLNNFPPLSSKNNTAAITAAINSAMSRSTQLRLRNSMKRSKIV
jgi:hypothetical protein